MARKHVIIGSGIAALSAAKTIRKISKDDSITMIAMEDCLPYSPALLPYLISKRIDESKIAIADESFFEKIGCSLHKGSEAVHLDTGKKEVICSDSSRHRYDTLLIATGSEPLNPPIKGLEEVGFIGCHTLADCRNIIERLQGNSSLAPLGKARPGGFLDGQKVALYGGGLVSLEIAAALLEAGHSVAVIARSRILRKYFEEGPASIVSGILGRHGAEFHDGKEIATVGRENGSVRMGLSDGSVLASHLLICCLGVKPRTGFLTDSGVDVGGGVLVNRHMRTNLADVYAAGDVAESTDYFFNQPGVNAIAPSAISQGRVAGANMAGGSATHKGWIAMNVFKFFGHSAFSIGLSHKEGFYALREQQKESFKEMVFKDDKLVGARFIDVDVDPGVLRYLIEESVDVSNKELLFQKPRDLSLWLMAENEKGVRLK